MEHYFDHENLLAYQLARDVARWVFHDARFPAGSASLKDQAVRAAQSVALNIAEGRSQAGNARFNHYRIAAGSAAEVCAALDLVNIEGSAVQQQKLRRVRSMLHGLGA